MYKIINTYKKLTEQEKKEAVSAAARAIAGLLMQYIKQEKSQ